MHVVFADCSKCGLCVTLALLMARSVVKSYQYYGNMEFKKTGPRAEKESIQLQDLFYLFLY